MLTSLPATRTNVSVICIDAVIYLYLRHVCVCWQKTPWREGKKTHLVRPVVAPGGQRVELLAEADRFVAAPGGANGHVTRSGVPSLGRWNAGRLWEGLLSVAARYHGAFVGEVYEYVN